MRAPGDDNDGGKVGRLSAALVTRAAIVAEALAWLGTPYRHQASLKGVGCDCLGLVRGVWRAVVRRPSRRRCRPTRRTGPRPAAARRSPRRGCGISCRWRSPRSRRATCSSSAGATNLPAKHAAILLAADRFVHAQQGAAVASAAFTPWWRRRAAYGFAFPGVEGKL